MKIIHIVYIKNNQGVIVFSQPCSTKNSALLYCKYYNSRCKKDNLFFHAEYDSHDAFFEEFLIDEKTIKLLSQLDDSNENI